MSLMVKLKKSKFGLRITLAFLLVVVVSFGILLLINSGKTLADCSETSGQEHRIEITSSLSGIGDSTASQCDRLIIVNNSQYLVRVAFGDHSNHYPYPNYEETVTQPGEEVVITLSEHGQFEVHNHLNDEEITYITINKNESLRQSRYTPDYKKFAEESKELDAYSDTE